MSDRVPGGVHRLHARHDLLAVLVEDDAVPVGNEVLARGQRRAFGRRAEPLVIGPEFQVGLRDVDLRVGKIAAAVRRHDAADVIDVGMGRDDRIDIVGIDAGRLEVRHQPAHRVGALDRAHSGLEHGELVAGVDDERVLIEHHVVGGQELIAHHLGQLFRGRAAKGVFRIADREWSVRDHRRLDGAELEAIESRHRRVEQRRLCRCLPRGRERSGEGRS